MTTPSTTEDNVTWDDDDEVELRHGTVESDVVSDGHPVAVLWIPDPEQRRGYREYYVRKQETPKAGRPMGFCKPGAKGP